MINCQKLGWYQYLLHIHKKNGIFNDLCFFITYNMFYSDYYSFEADNREKFQVRHVNYQILAVFLLELIATSLFSNSDMREKESPEVKLSPWNIRQHFIQNVGSRKMKFDLLISNVSSYLNRVFPNRYINERGHM